MAQPIVKGLISMIRDIAAQPIVEALILMITDLRAVGKLADEIELW